MRATRILVVDDDTDIRVSTSLLLAAKGYDVLQEEHADHVLEATRRFLPDVILQDVQMPGLSVDKLVHDIRETAPRSRIIIFSASANVEETMKRVGADGILKKPFDVADLTAIVGGTVPASDKAPPSAVMGIPPDGVTGTQGG